MNKKQIETIIYMELKKTIIDYYGYGEANYPSYDLSLLAERIINKLQEEKVLKGVR